MKLLLDAHTLVWATTEPEKLPPRVREAIAEESNDLVMSLATIWELANKVAMGRLPALGASVLVMIRTFKDLGVTLLPINEQDVIDAATLPPHHLDPFDRMLVAQARAHGLTIVSVDSDLPKYDVPILWS